MCDHDVQCIFSLEWRRVLYACCVLFFYLRSFSPRALCFSVPQGQVFPAATTLFSETGAINNEAFVKGEA